MTHFSSRSTAHTIHASRNGTEKKISSKIVIKLASISCIIRDGTASKAISKIIIKIAELHCNLMPYPYITYFAARIAACVIRKSMFIPASTISIIMNDTASIGSSQINIKTTGSIRNLRSEAELNCDLTPYPFKNVYSIP